MSEAVKDSKPCPAIGLTEGTPGAIQMRASYFIQVSEKERAATNGQARLALLAGKPNIEKWKAIAKKSPAARAFEVQRFADEIPACLPSKGERLLRTKVQVDMPDSCYLIESFFYESEWAKLPKISSLYNARFSHSGPSS